MRSVRCIIMKTAQDINVRSADARSLMTIRAWSSAIAQNAMATIGTARIICLRTHVGEEDNYEKTKIICTMGPAVKQETLRGLIRGGMDVARFIFARNT